MPDLIRRRLVGEQHGFTMVAAMGVMLVVLALSAAAFAAADGDIRLSGRSGEQKQAYAAAEAGVADYLYHLTQNPNYWSLCTDVPAPTGQPYAPVNQPWDGNGADPRHWRKLADSGAQYTIELLPVDGDTTCDRNDPEASMLDPDSGAFRIRATGRVSATSGVRRSIVATFKARTFLDYLYFTEVEAQDPIIWTKLNSCGGTPDSERTPDCYPTRGQDLGNGQRGPDLAAWGSQQCSKYWRPPGRRGSAGFPGQIELGNQWFNYGVKCTEIVFGENERIEGPFHTNDGINVCNDPVFGRNATDRVEVSAEEDANPDEEPYRASPGCSANPQFTGTWTPGAPELTPPQTNSELKSEADYRFRGAVEIVLNGDGTMTVTNDLQTPRTRTLPQPEDGVIYAEASACEGPFDPYLPRVYGENVATGGCGSVSVRGTYTKNLTIAADDDIVITDDLRKSGDVLLGLIANNFVRVHHPALFDDNGSAQWRDAPSQIFGGGASPRCRNIDGSPTQNVTIEAAILALNHSFTVDRYGCGAGLGKLNVIGAIAQKFRGVVGVGSGASGFIKNYKYDNRLRFRSPPKFIKPQNASWQVVRQVEQSPAR
jgi:hypothetical protein